MNARRYSALCATLDRAAYCHVPDGALFSPAALVQSDEPERWSAPGQPTIYLAGDVGVAVAELGRHTPHLPADPDRRRLLRVRAALERLLGLSIVFHDDEHRATPFGPGDEKLQGATGNRDEHELPAVDRGRREQA